jgi:hypothetical protein
MSNRIAACSDDSPQLDLPVKAQSDDDKGKRWLPTIEAITRTTNSKSNRKPHTLSALPNVECAVVMDGSISAIVFWRRHALAAAQ